jgi:molybdate transport system substrate-binding protein
VVAAALVLGSMTGCSSGDPDAQITVLAASSLRAPFAQIAEEFQRDNPGTTVRFNFAGSSDLVAQLQQGAPGDVLATADEPTMAMATAEGLTASPTVFATNTMTIVVPIDNPAGVTGLHDLTDPELNVVVCAEQVPCGAATTRIEAASGLEIQADSEETSVTDVLNKVATGEADAGIVYVSDVATQAGSVTAIDIADDVNSTNEYPITVLAASNDQQAASAFVQTVTGPQGQRILTQAGFGPAPTASSENRS